jgi:glycosidase
MSNHWSYDSVFYHIYPLGFCAAPERNDFASDPVPRLEKIHGWIDHLIGLGVTGLYLGPLFESSVHGYDTADYFTVDRRLGTNRTLAELVLALRAAGIRVILDGVFNHVGRDFWAFRDVREHGADSKYCDWFEGLKFGGQSPFGDPFTYNAWSGNYDLVKLNLRNPAVTSHLLEAVAQWIREFNIDGLRLDVADCVDMAFLRQLSKFCRETRPGFWLLGELIHGDYRQWVNPETLDSATNYECYKGLFSSHNDRNYFEIAYALNRQFGEGGIYRGLPLYSFADNHDVDRVASSLKNHAHLTTLYALLFTMPGVPSVYYGSEWGIKGKRTTHDDSVLRPCVELSDMTTHGARVELIEWIRRLAQVRAELPALRYGDYRQAHVAHEQLAFARQTPEQTVIVAVNAAEGPARFEIDVPLQGEGQLVDRLHPGEHFAYRHGKAMIGIAPHGSRILAAETI